MKKLMIALSAAALAFGLQAQLPEGVVAKEGFAPLTDESEGFTMTAGEGTVTTSTTAYISSYVTGGQIAPNAFGENTAGDNLQLKTPFSSPATLAFTATSMEGLYFDSMVKFTACDEAPSTTDYSDAKIIVWVKENEDANGNITKNLMVTAGNIADPAKPAPKDFDCGLVGNYGIAGDDDWCRLTIKAIPNIGKGSSGFIVFVNGKTVEITGEYKDIGLAETDANWKMVVWLQQNKLFPSLAADDTDLSAVEFAGQGGVDDLVVSTIEPRDANGGLFYNEATPAIAAIDGDSTGLTSVDLIQAKLNEAAANTTVKLLYDVTGDLSGNLNFPNAYTLTFDLNGKTFNGNLTCGEFSKVTITDSSANKDGKIEGTVESDSDDPLFVLDAGKVKISTNDSFRDNVKPASEDKMFGEKDGYYVLVTKEDGTATYPYLLKDVSGITALQTAVKGGDAKSGIYYRQTADIDFSQVAGWKGIGGFGKQNADGIKKFSGNYDGNGFTIKGVNFGEGNYGGFFGCCEGATIKNLTIEVASIPTIATDGTQEYGYAAFAGSAANTTFEGCTAKGNIGSDSNGITHTGAGFLVKADQTGKVTFKNCTNELNIVIDYWDNPKVGGFIGISENAELIGCVNKGNIKSLVNKAGAATSSTGLGGIVGFIQSNPHTITDCVNEGTITLVDNAVSHGKTGSNLIGYGSIIGRRNKDCTVSGCTAIGTIVSVNPATDGLNFATISDGVATFVANDAVVAKGSYKVMANGAPDVPLANIGDTITIDTSLAAVNVVTTAENAKVVQEGNVYTVVGLGASFTMATVENATAQYKIDEGDWNDYTEEVTDVAAGSTIAWQYVPADGYMLTGTASGSVTAEAGAKIELGSKDIKADVIIAKIGETPYASLEAAAVAAQNDDTITLQIDLTVPAGATFALGKSIILDLNGKTIDYPTGTSSTYVLTVNDGNSLVVSNGTVTTTGRGVMVAGNLTLGDGLNLTSACRSINCVGVDGNWAVDGQADHPAIVTVAKGATVTHGSGDTVAVFVRGSASSTRTFYQAKAILNVYGTIIDNYEGDDSWGITTNGGNATVAEVNFYDGSVYTSASWIVRLTQGDLNLYGGTLTSAKQAIVLNCGTLNVPADSTVKVVAGGKNAIVLERNTNTYPRNQYSELPIYQASEIVANIAGGEFSSTEDAISSVSLLASKTPAAEFVSGGYFKGDIALDCVVEGYKTVASATKEGYYEIGPDPVSGTGTEEDPWLIDSRRHLKAFRNGVNDGTYAPVAGTFVQQTADIDLRRESWTDIGTGLTSDKLIAFNATYDGQNHVVSNFVLSGASYCGFFRASECATIKNLQVLDARSPDGCSAVSILAGDVEPAGEQKFVVDNVTVSGNIEGSHNVGGFSAWLQGTVEFVNCTNLANCTTHRAKVGGFSPYYGGTAGTDSLSFVNCCNKGTITLAKNIDGKDAVFAVGGILAYAQSTAPVSFTGCVNEGAIVGTMEAKAKEAAKYYDTSYLGGIMGRISGKIAATFTDCVNSGTISAAVADALYQNAAVAGIVGGASDTGATITLADTTVQEGTTLTATVGEGKTSYEGAFVGNNNCTVTLSGKNTSVASIKSLGNKPLDGLNFATISEGIATFIADSDVVADGSYKVMTAGAPDVTLANIGDTITIDTSLATVNVVTTAADAYVATEGNVYTVTTKTTPAITVTIEPAIAEYTTGMTLPTPTVKVEGDLAYTGTWDKAIAEPAAGTTNTYTYTVSVAATDKTLAAEGSATYQVYKAAAQQEIKPGETKEIEAETQEEAEKKAADIPVAPANEEAAAAGQAAVLTKKVVKNESTGKYEVQAVINTKAEAYKAPDVANEAVATELTAIASDPATEKDIELAPAKVTPGLYYHVEAATDLGFADPAQGDWSLATSAGVNLNVPAVGSGAKKAFYKVVETTNPKPANK